MIPWSSLGSLLEPFGKSPDSHVAEVSQGLLCLSQTKKVWPIPLQTQASQKGHRTNKMRRARSRCRPTAPITSAPSFTPQSDGYRFKTWPCPKDRLQSHQMERQRDISEMPHWALWTFKTLRSSSSKWHHCPSVALYFGQFLNYI